MHHTRQYDLDLPEAERVEKGVADCKAWLAGKAFDALLEYLADCTTEDQVHFGCSFVGIQGYPATALYERYVNKDGEHYIGVGDNND